MNAPETKLDTRFSDADAVATSWDDTRRVLEAAELFWITTVRRDGRPHTTPLVAVWLDDAIYFCTGPSEQKAVNLTHNPHVVVTTGCNEHEHGRALVFEVQPTKVLAFGKGTFSQTRHRFAPGQSGEHVSMNRPPDRRLDRRRGLRRHLPQPPRRQPQQQIPAGMQVPAAADPAALKRLPPGLHTAYVTVTDALHPVFLAAAGAAALAFILSWFLRELPLRATAHGPSGQQS
jgi:hypothetical protein